MMTRADRLYDAASRFRLGKPQDDKVQTLKDFFESAEFAATKDLLGAAKSDVTVASGKVPGRTWGSIKIDSGGVFLESTQRTKSKKGFSREKTWRRRISIEKTKKLIQKLLGSRRKKGWELEIVSHIRAGVDVVVNLAPE